jgi:hypothetical protein
VVALMVGLNAGKLMVMLVVNLGMVLGSIVC